MLLCLEVLETKCKVHEVLANYAEIWKLSVLLLVLLYKVVKQVCGRLVLTGKLESLSAQMLLRYRAAVNNIPGYSEGERTVLIQGHSLKCL